MNTRSRAKHSRGPQPSCGFAASPLTVTTVWCVLAVVVLHLGTQVVAEGGDLEFQNHYEVLGIPQDATVTDVRKAYKKLAMKWHPDKNPDNKKEAEEQFLRISRAKEVLTDTRERQIFDEDLMFGFHSSSRGSGHAGPGDFGGSRDDIFAQMRRERLRKKQSYQNSWLYQFDDKLTYVLPTIFVCGLLWNFFSSGDAAGGRNGGRPNGVGGTGRGDRTGEQREASQPSEAPTGVREPRWFESKAPTLSPLKSEYLTPNTSYFVVIVAMDDAKAAEEIDWNKLQTVAESRRRGKIRFFWVDLNAADKAGNGLAPFVHQNGLRATPSQPFCIFAVRPKKQVAYTFGEAMPLDETLRSGWATSLEDWADSLLGLGTLRLTKIAVTLPEAQ